MIAIPCASGLSVLRCQIGVCDCQDEMSGFTVKQVRFDEAAGFHVSRETMERLDNFAALLLQWSEKLNLVAEGDRELLWTRHIADSLQLLPLIRDHSPPFVDLGSGAGFPGLVLAIGSGQHVHLIEADHRKAAFLREAARTTAATVTVHAKRIEAVTLPPVSVVTARALAPLPKLLALAQPLLKPGGVLLALKGRYAKQELTAAQAHWNMQAAAIPSRTDPAASILQISDISRAR
jgi:16S rRNA (guanine527-N7)-methyltransferase